jgi:hypothetical protein
VLAELRSSQALQFGLDCGNRTLGETFDDQLSRQTPAARFPRRELAARDKDHRRPRDEEEHPKRITGQPQQTSRCLSNADGPELIDRRLTFAKDQSERMAGPSRRSAAARSRAVR